MRCHILPSILVASMLLISTTSMAEEAETKELIPLPTHFSNVDVYLAQRLASKAAPIFDATLNDYPTARFKNVRAMYQGHWRTGKRTYYICGWINARNRMGGYIGWQGFLIADNVQQPPDLYYENDEIERILYNVVCIQAGRGDRFVFDTSVDYGKSLRGG